MNQWMNVICNRDKVQMCKQQKKNEICNSIRIEQMYWIFYLDTNWRFVCLFVCLWVCLFVCILYIVKKIDDNFKFLKKITTWLIRETLIEKQKDYLLVIISRLWWPNNNRLVHEQKKKWNRTLACFLFIKWTRRDLLSFFHSVCLFESINIIIINSIKIWTSAHLLQCPSIL